ncbi:PP2C family protein-serine/threonine phosphatase [Geofilum rubicundum]|uniref:Response regulatory protein n=1 Tax=Geofilum rubicundum JCM 15548 TaxID=1236989 RepID=A0A0E9LXI7_9BACT|nr:response regulator [Geofilum rubicundum]GAO30297.1 response regulatory protein [Geofilum rubicundum JCM 15548]
MFQQAPVLLLVDDSNVNLEILKDILKRYPLLTATNGKEALLLATAEPKPDLILLDVVMPGMDGFETCRKLKERAVTRNIPVIFITGQNDSDHILKGFEVGAVDYITKPFNIPELKARVKTQLTIKMARDQNLRLLQKIELVNKQLTDSIRYAQKIQNASLPKQTYLDQVMPEYFVLLKPRDIVSGDFYWVGEVDSRLLVVAADSTGHGVPGAFMSMFGVAYLNQIVGYQSVSIPSQILDRLRSIVIDSFQQTESSEVKDGMDIGVLSIDRTRKEIEFAGAFNPLYIIRNNELTIVSADHMPVSIGEVDRPYHNHIIPYQKGDALYLFTDGYASQFGGPDDKKIKSTGFRQLLIEHHHLPMCEQKTIYDQFFEEWKGNGEQVDDVLLIGIRL